MTEAQNDNIPRLPPPRTVRIGRKRQLADGRVAVPWPASCPWAAAQRAARDWLTTH